MPHCSISSWITDEWNDAMEDIARDKYVPLAMGLGATSIRMVRTGENSFVVITEYIDAAAAEAAQQKAAQLRAQAAEELPMSLEGVSQGPVFASG